eukprot:370811_1
MRPRKSSNTPEVSTPKATPNNEVSTPEATRKSPNTLPAETKLSAHALANLSLEDYSVSDTSSSEHEDLHNAEPSVVSDSSDADDYKAREFMMSQQPTCRGTQRLNDVNDIILDEMNALVGPPGKSGWMDKKQSSPPYSWLKRWVMVKEGYILWSEWEITPDDEVDYREMRRWNKCIYLARDGISVSEVKSKRNRRFKLGTKKRDFLFRTRDMSERDKWM